MFHGLTAAAVATLLTTAMVVGATSSVAAASDTSYNEDSLSRMISEMTRNANNLTYSNDNLGYSQKTSNPEADSRNLTSSYEYAKGQQSASAVRTDYRLASEDFLRDRENYSNDQSNRQNSNNSSEYSDENSSENSNGSQVNTTNYGPFPMSYYTDFMRNFGSNNQSSSNENSSSTDYNKDNEQRRISNIVYANQATNQQSSFETAKANNSLAESRIRYSTNEVNYVTQSTDYTNSQNNQVDKMLEEMRRSIDSSTKYVPNVSNGDNGNNGSGNTHSQSQINLSNTLSNLPAANFNPSNFTISLPEMPINSSSVFF